MHDISKNSLKHYEHIKEIFIRFDSSDGEYDDNF